MRTKVAVVPCDCYDRSCVENSIQKAVDLLGGVSHFIKPGSNVLIKPNLCLAEPPERCITTHPEVVRKIVTMFSQAGANVIVGDNPVGDADRSRMNTIWQRTGIAEILLELDCERSFLDRAMVAFSLWVKEKEYSYYISKEVLSMDIIVNVPKFKTHSLMTFTGAVKNLYGLLPGNSKKKLHSQLPVHKDFAEMLLDIYRRVRPGLNIMDAVIGIEGDGPGAQGIPRKIGVIMASEDAIALDSVATAIMGLEPNLIHTNRMGALKGFGESNLSNIEIIGNPINDFIINDFKQPMTFRYRPDITHKIFSLSRPHVYIKSDYCKACGLCVPNCPADSISIDHGTAKIDQKKCISCMTCHEICPSCAVFTEMSSFYNELTGLRNKRIEKQRKEGDNVVCGKHIRPGTQKS